MKSSLNQPVRNNSINSIQDFLKQIKTSSYYCQHLQFKLKFQTFQQINIKIPNSKQHQFIIKTPQIKFLLNDELINKITQDIVKSKRTKNGIILHSQSYQNNQKNKNFMEMHKIHYFTQNDQDDIGVWQQAEDAFCAGFIVQKQQNYQLFNKRLLAQFKKCLERKFQIVYAKNNKILQSSSSLNQIQKILYKNYRFFLVYQPVNPSNPSSMIRVNKLMYYPDVKFSIKPVKLVPAKFIANKVYEQVLQFKQKYDYGYLSLSNTKTSQIRFLLIDKFDPQLNQNPPPMIGMWMAIQKFQSKEEMRTYFWAVIMEYLRNPSLKVKLSVNHPNTCILWTIQKPQKATAYLIEILDQSCQNSTCWKLKYETQNTYKIPEQYIFNDQQIIFEQEKEESDIQSIHNGSLHKGGSNSKNGWYANNQPLTNSIMTGNMSKSNSFSPAVMQLACNPPALLKQSSDLSKSTVFMQNKSILSNTQAIVEQKELQIKFLKKQLQFYKNRCEMLQKMLNNPGTMLQFQAWNMMNQQHNMQMNPMINNSMIGQPHVIGMQSSSLPVQNLNTSKNIINPSQTSQKQIPVQSNLNINKDVNKSSKNQNIEVRKQIAVNNKQTSLSKVALLKPQQQPQDLDEQSQPEEYVQYRDYQKEYQQQTQIRQSQQQKKYNQKHHQQQQLSPKNDKIKKFQYRNNISFAQQNSLLHQNKFTAQQSGFFGRSPQFKISTSERQQLLQQSQIYENPLAINNNIKDKNIFNFNVQSHLIEHEFSFDRKDDQLINSFGIKSKLAKEVKTEIDNKFINKKVEDKKQYKTKQITNNNLIEVNIKDKDKEKVKIESIKQKQIEIYENKNEKKEVQIDKKNKKINLQGFGSSQSGQDDDEFADIISRYKRN